MKKPPLSILFLSFTFIQITHAERGAASYRNGLFERVTRACVRRVREENPHRSKEAERMLKTIERDSPPIVRSANAGVFAATGMWSAARVLCRRTPWIIGPVAAATGALIVTDKVLRGDIKV